jgi:hypothetical protein
MVVVFHDSQSTAGVSPAQTEEAMRKNFVEYGQRVEKIISEVGKAAGSSH